MNLTETIRTTPMAVEKSVRSDKIRSLTSGRGGKIIPLAYAPMLREDRLANGRVTVQVDMAETAETLMNAVNVNVMAYFVPFLAFERFEGSLDRLNRSYMGQPDKEGGDVVPFFEALPYSPDFEVYRALGVHAPTGMNLNSAVVEAYNAIVNHRRRARSTKLPEREWNRQTLAEAFWVNPGMAHIVPDFDQAMIDGEAPLTLNVPKMPVEGIALKSNQLTNAYKETFNVKKTGGTAAENETGWVDRNSVGGTQIMISEDPDNPGFPGIFAELQAEGVTLSLANIEMAKKTAAFARMRKQYSGLDDDYIIDLLMQAIRVPDAQMAQPILLDRQRAVIGYTQRFATDSGNLDKHVTTGTTAVTLNMRTPPMNTGGVIMITAEVVPDQLFERQQDYFLTTTDADALPDFIRDYADPEKVARVANTHADVHHSVPDGTFGYAPLNHEWKRDLARIGGKYYRELGAGFVENRQKFWSQETVDPGLREDFYLVNDLDHSVFADTMADPFEITTLGELTIVGNTVFGKGLQEDTGDYDSIAEEVDTDRIDQAE
jgi:hypothetical protein